MSSAAEKELYRLQHDTFRYFTHEADAATGLVPDSTEPGVPASVAVIGLTLTAYPVGVERGYLSREEAAAHTLVTLRFVANAPRGPEPDATSYHGLYYHFLDMKTGRRAWESELSTVDTAIFLAGALTAARYFDGPSDVERKIRELADVLYREADWAWAADGGVTLTHGWTPEAGFLAHRWTGYSEALLLYVLALGSPTFPISPKSYRAFTST